MNLPNPLKFSRVKNGSFRKILANRGDLARLQASPLWLC